MKQFLIFFVIFLFTQNLFAQVNEADTTFVNNTDSLKSLDWIADSAYGVFRTERFSSMRTFFHSYATYKEMIDTSMAGDQTEYTQFVMYNTRWNYLRIQFGRMIKKIHKQGIEWKYTELDTVYFKTGQDQGINYAYIHWVIKVKNKKKYTLSAVALEIKNNWYIMDELKYEGLVPEPKTAKGKKRLKIKIPDNIKTQN
ncbi:MAG: hypothetical protein PSX81_13240 [bacterium]|nr:hypothetical protein [bacterium]